MLCGGNISCKGVGWLDVNVETGSYKEITKLLVHGKEETNPLLSSDKD